MSRAADGNYLFLGRLDRQVKRRGFRIELGEIETALAGREDILEAAAVAVDDGKLGTAIIAFVRAVLLAPSAWSKPKPTVRGRCRCIWCPTTSYFSTPCRREAGERSITWL